MVYYSATITFTISIYINCDLIQPITDIENFLFTIEPPTNSALNPTIDFPDEWSTDGKFTSTDIWYWLGTEKSFALNPQIVA